MSISKLAHWGEKILALLRDKKKTQAFRIVRRLRKLVLGLGRYRMFIHRFKNVCDKLNHFLSILKNEGLNQKSYKKAQIALETLSPKNRIRIRLTQWLDRHIEIHSALGLGDTPLPVSSDIIESLFGKFKAIVGRSPRSEFNRLILLIPALCGHQPTEVNISQKLKTVSHRELMFWIKTNIQTTQWKLRRAFNRGQLRIEMVPKVGKIRGIAA